MFRVFAAATVFIVTYSLHFIDDLRCFDLLQDDIVGKTSNPSAASNLGNRSVQIVGFEEDNMPVEMKMTAQSKSDSSSCNYNDTHRDCDHDRDHGLVNVNVNIIHVNVKGDNDDNADDDDPSKLTLSQRWKALMHPVYFSSAPLVVRANNDNTKTSDRATYLIMVPEAFRIWFYIAFISLILLGIFVTQTFGDIDYNNNPIINNFGANNLCIFFDVPPFTYFGAFLYLFVLQLILIYEVLDIFRVYDR